ncbi:DUF882 domain-containing protein [Pseudaminobacter arsenicus]|uniref:Murein endopeptidase K n=1 Tax=Borborobacter arsenicus TaxID=1851146 RepID=A0A432VBC9_9HYPH|nr:YcbK family protein [Pseudaminobacter arsenicus]RUM99468.1 DUF882 domain-containing protein [Pseudaminobacter arsenicus]
MAALVSAFLASCSSTTDPNLDIGTPGFAQAGPSISTDAAADIEQIQTASTGDSQDADAQTPVSATETVMDEGDAELPAQVASVPSAKPGAEGVAATQTAAAVQPVVAEDGATQQQAAATQAPVPASEPEATQAGDAKPAEAADTPAGMDNPVYATAGEPPKTETLAPKKKGFLSAFFGSSPAPAAPSPVREQKAKPIVNLASATPSEKPVVMASLGGEFGSENALPGVRQSALFEIKRKSGIDDDSDVDLHEEDDGSYEVASAAGLARLAPNGLLKQTDRVDVGCLKPSLVRVLKSVEQHYGQKIVVTSGYRNASRNRRARGAKNSLHMYCAAADVQVPGVSKWELANYVRSMPGRGGVGTYCHTNSVHIDVGPERDWNWRCRRRK